MNSSASLWLLCLVGVALLNQALCKPADAVLDEDYPDDEQDGDEDADEDFGPPPQMKTDPLKLDLRPGVVALLPCHVEGNPDGYSRLWRKDTTESLFTGSVSTTKDPRITLLADGTLEIRAINISDEGKYLCQISSTPRQEVVHTLKLLRDKAPLKPASIAKLLPNDDVVEVKKSKSLKLECIASGVPDPEIFWFKDGHMLHSNDPIRNGVYHINEVTLEHQGVYECRATNGQDSPDSRKVAVHVLYAPEIQIERDVIPTGEGYESELRCTVTGYNKPEVKWHKKDHLLRNTENIKIESRGNDHTLKILKTKVEDFGEYACKAKNDEGERKAVITLTGSPAKPTLISADTDPLSKIPSVLFDIESFSPVVEYELEYKDGKEEEWKIARPVVEPSIGGLHFRAKYTLSEQAAGVYKMKLRAKNAHGWSESSVEYEIPKAVEGSSAAELRISFALLVSLLVAHFYC